jgi:hypothetical protein
MIGRLLRGLTVLLLGLGCGGLMALSPDIALPVLVLLLPGLVMMIIDPSPSHATARAMLLCQAATCARPVAEAWYRCEGLPACMAYLAGPGDIAKAWLAAALAFIATQILPIGLKLLDDKRLQARETELTARRQALSTEWGMGEQAGD